MDRSDKIKVKAYKALEKGKLKKFERLDLRRSKALEKEMSGLTAKSPYMMYGEKSDIMMSESPLAKYGCSKKYKKGK